MRGRLLTFLAACAVGAAAPAAFLMSQPLSAAPSLAPAAERADAIIVEKSERRLLLMRDGAVLGEYSVALGSSPLGDKEQEGDGRTPEGRYTVDYKNAASAFHLSLHISYPNAADRREAEGRGVSPGGDIMIHGLPNRLGFLGPLHRLFDWTEGCIAVTNGEIEDIWTRVAVGTPIEIRE